MFTAHKQQEQKSKSRKFLRQNRLSHPNEFKAVFQMGRKLSSRCMAVHLKKNTFDFPRIGIIVGKRNVRKAVMRNLIKRIIRESFRLSQSKLGCFDIVIVVYKNYAMLSKPEMRVVVDEMLNRL